jgi:hypothetical protein
MDGLPIMKRLIKGIEHAARVGMCGLHSCFEDACLR